jgi:septal ring factor EnvC (AmiA/AmiB activator)
MIIDHIEKQETLFQIVKSTLPKKISKENEDISSNENNNNAQQQQQQQQLTQVLADVITSTNSVIAFHDNSSAIYGYHVQVLVPSNPTTGTYCSM